MSNRRHQLCLLLCLAVLVAGCHPRTNQGTLVVTQTPPSPPSSLAAGNALDARYPLGSRIIAAPPQQGPDHARILSTGLVAAGAPRLSPDGSQILFCGKTDPQAAWQIYRTDLRGSLPQRLTDMPGGAMDPGWLPGGRFVFVSPVPTPSQPAPSKPLPALYAQDLEGGSPQRLSSALGAVSDPTVLQDGRILFVAELNDPEGNHDGLFTVNSDGTEVTAFAALHDAPSRIRRPRELPDGRVIFLAQRLEGPDSVDRLEAVELRRPFSSREPLGSWAALSVLAADPGLDFPVIASCAPQTASELNHATAAIVARDPTTATLEVVFDDPAWNDLEAVQCAERMKPMGRLSTIDPALDFGRVLCLNANLSQQHPSSLPSLLPAASRVRFLALTPDGGEQPLGETEVHPDGSFLVELPADRALTLETLDADGQVIRRLHPGFWVRPGENRACIGCHEPHNSAPGNFRPLAVKAPAVRLGFETPASAVARHP